MEPIASVLVQLVLVRVLVCRVPVLVLAEEWAKGGEKGNERFR
jgi:hypothetical protein